MHHWKIAILAGAVALAACDDGGSDPESGAPDASEIEADAGPQADAAPPTLESQLQSFCDSAAQARCAWAFDCVGDGPALYSGLGLQGPTIEDCAADWSATCFADVEDRAARGTLDFSADAVEACINGLTDATCVDPNAVNEWVADWHGFVQRRCGSVIRGARGSGEACETSKDCQVATEICDGTCRSAMNSDIGSPCEASGDGVGSLRVDSECPGAACVDVGANDQGISGICTSDCQGVPNCPAGSNCLQLSVNNEPPSFFCTLPCEEDDDCTDDLVCVPINPMGDPNRKHCWVSNG